MCGICGYITERNVDKENLTKMSDMLRHRGPDDSGEEMIQMNSRHIGIAQRRLSIVDLSPKGHQPMWSHDRKAVIVFNGEIYNYQDIRQELSDYPFSSSTDTEVIIAAYQRWGIDCIKRFNGMFAFCLIDLLSETVFLARDRMEKKPLYYYFDGNELIFASELKPIIKCGFAKMKINQDIIGKYLVNQYIPSPDTILESVYKVGPGELISFHGSRLEKNFYWVLEQEYAAKRDTLSLGYDSSVDMLDSLLKEAIRYRLIGDVPIGILLSGGYDSSLIAAITSCISTKPIDTFTIGVSDKRYNEADEAQKIASHIHSRHHEMYIDEADLLELVDSIPEYYDEPFADSSQIATMLVSKLARSEVTAVLSGDGGDELFCGYPRYKDMIWVQRLTPMGGLIRRFGLDRKSLLPYSVYAIVRNDDKGTLTQFNTLKKRELAEEMLPYAQNVKLEAEKQILVKNLQIRRMLLDAKTYLPDDILCKVDRASMKYSLETRCPYLDINIVEFCLSLPQKYKYRKGSGKRILKDLAYRYIPREMLDRPKSGFSVPIDKWLRNELRNRLIEYSSQSYLSAQGIFNAASTSNIVKSFLCDGGEHKRGQDISQFIWAFYCFQSWYQHYESFLDIPKAQ